MRNCLKEPIVEIFAAASDLSAAVDAHLSGDVQKAAALLIGTNSRTIRAWTESIWGKYDPIIHRITSRPAKTVEAGKIVRPLPRMPDKATCAIIVARDGYHCRFCGIPVIPSAVRKRLVKLYPFEVPWGRRNAEQHAALQCMWLQFDHVLPNERGGTSDLENVVVTCAPCNFGRMQHTIEECELVHPLEREPTPSWPGYSKWDGLTRLSD